MSSIITFVSKNNKNTSSETVCSWMLKDMYKHHPRIFIQTAIDACLHVVHKMTAVEAAAMWIDAGVFFRSAKTILQHLYAKFKSTL